MKNLFLVLTLLASTILTSSIQAQNYVDLARFRYDNTPLNQFDSTTASTRVQEITLDATIPFEFKNGNAFITGFDFQQVSTKVNPVDANLTAVYTVLLKLGIKMNYGEKWSGTYMFMPKLSSDLKKISSKDFQYGGLALFSYKKSSHLKYKFGMYYNSELFGPFFVPLLGLYYLSPSNKLEINATLPVWADINYRFNNWLRAGFSFSAFVRTYNINEPQYSENGEYLVKTSNEPKLYLQFEPLESLIIQTKIGYSIGRRYKIYDVQDQVTFGFSAFRFGDDRSQLNSEFDDGLIFEVRLLYRYHIKDKEK